MRWALGAWIDSKARNSWETVFMGDVFSSSSGDGERESRLVKVTAAFQRVRVRSAEVWAGLHWCGLSVLCSGVECPACQSGFPKRRYCFVAVDRPGQAIALLQLTERDHSQCVSLDPSGEVTMRIGSQFQIRRKITRQPMEIEYCGFTENLLKMPEETIKVDLLRIHGIRATEADVHTGGARRLVQLRAAEASSTRRAFA